MSKEHKHQSREPRPGARSLRKVLPKKIPAVYHNDPIERAWRIRAKAELAVLYRHVGVIDNRPESTRAKREVLVLPKAVTTKSAEKFVEANLLCRLPASRHEAAWHIFHELTASGGWPRKIGGVPERCESPGTSTTEDQPAKCRLLSAHVMRCGLPDTAGGPDDVAGRIVRSEKREEIRRNDDVIVEKNDDIPGGV
jgi:hypothetical protein